VSFNRFTHSPIAEYHDEIDNLPFNMNIFHQLWRAITPEETISLVCSDMDDVVEMALQEAQCPN